jgi:dTDP-4-dehydrorhamnose 3,5-epimerase
MKVIKTKLAGTLLIEPDVYGDDRGFFYELYQKKRFVEIGLGSEFVQDNRSSSIKGVLRGLHFQKKKPQGKLVTVTHGEVFDVAVDLRPNSSTFGEFESVILSDKNKLQFYIPEGFAHGFCVMSDRAEFHYKCTEYYDPLDEGGIIWNDGDINVPWPVKSPILSKKDILLPKLLEIKPYFFEENDND